MSSKPGDLPMVPPHGQPAHAEQDKGYHQSIDFDGGHGSSSPKAVRGGEMEARPYCEPSQTEYPPI
jgi:hypothetical protein